MEHINNLRSVFSFPGCSAQATVHSYRGNPEAIVVTLQRRQKKRYAVPVGPSVAPTMTRGRDTSATWRQPIDVCSSSFASGESIAPAAEG